MKITQITIKLVNTIHEKSTWKILESDKTVPLSYRNSPNILTTIRLQRGLKTLSTLC